MLPREALRPFVECFWSWEGDGLASLPRLLPEPSAELVLHYGQPFRCRSSVRDYGLLPRIHLVGFRDRYYDIESSGRVGFLSARLKPTALSSLLGRSPAEWANDFASAQDLWREGGDALEEAFLSAPDNRERARVVEDFLESRLAASRRPDRPWECVLAAMARATESRECRVDRIADGLGTTVRSLQRLFRERLGLSPKTYLRLKRFELLVTSCLPESGTGYLQHGLDLGFYDQSHIIRDFEEFLGMTPSRFLEDRGYLSLLYNTAL